MMFLRLRNDRSVIRSKYPDKKKSGAYFRFLF